MECVCCWGTELAFLLLLLLLLLLHRRVYSAFKRYDVIDRVYTLSHVVDSRKAAFIFIISVEGVHFASGDSQASTNYYSYSCMIRYYPTPLNPHPIPHVPPASTAPILSLSFSVLCTFETPHIHSTSTRPTVSFLSSPRRSFLSSCQSLIPPRNTPLL